MISFGLSHPGRVRLNNEVVFVVGERARTLIVRQTYVPQPDETHSRHRGHVFLVTDGVGGPTVGEVASRLVTDTVEQFLPNTFRRLTASSAVGQDALRELQAALRADDARLFEQVGKQPGWRGVGTTLSLAFASVLAAEADPEAACRRLIIEANRNGGEDNITLVVARFDPPGRHQR